MTLPAAYFARPITHRGLHDRSKGVIENSMSAFKAAIDAGYGIELDVQQSFDGQAMVFHDYDMARLTGESGPIQTRTAETIRGMTLSKSHDTIFDLPAVLDLIDGRVPVLIEVKDQDGAMGPNVGPLERAVADALDGYRGDAAVMSFNPHSTRMMSELSPNRPRGLVTDPFRPSNWAPLSPKICRRLRDIPDYGWSTASFISHKAADLRRPRVAELKAKGAQILCWTIKSQAKADKALEIAQNITFEGFIPA
ncbi:Glycerophosphoryl diester phosphodiesterase [Litoreibacter ascidiaceicola]|uniref:Glycerophosphoryl diester phosphodiesterase n=1 Tax=Litoreibacter ascidiaceicola TaxID=1486859 RepID=A0A1M5AZY1_9RHOB|nr:glycerophosphodiester phosphodiesterase family protein [Litoreibacter ascidiaceicola]SHF35627.1 Glycerophosphoryl diester phosphodiesterase [Litoreibacter ascidiaceicola]